MADENKTASDEDVMSHLDKVPDNDKICDQYKLSNQDRASIQDRLPDQGELSNKDKGSKPNKNCDQDKVSNQDKALNHDKACGQYIVSNQAIVPNKDKVSNQDEVRGLDTESNQDVESNPDKVSTQENMPHEVIVSNHDKLCGQYKVSNQDKVPNENNVCNQYKVSNPDKVCDQYKVSNQDEHQHKVTNQDKQPDQDKVSNHDKVSNQNKVSNQDKVRHQYQASNQDKICDQYKASNQNRMPNQDKVSEQEKESDQKPFTHWYGCFGRPHRPSEERCRFGQSVTQETLSYPFSEKVQSQIRQTPAVFIKRATPNFYKHQHNFSEHDNRFAFSHDAEFFKRASVQMQGGPKLPSLVRNQHHGGGEFMKDACFMKSSGKRTTTYNSAYIPMPMQDKSPFGSFAKTYPKPKKGLIPPTTNLDREDKMTTLKQIDFPFKKKAFSRHPPWRFSYKGQYNMYPDTREIIPKDTYVLNRKTAAFPRPNKTV